MLAASPLRKTRLAPVPVPVDRSRRRRLLEQIPVGREALHVERRIQRRLAVRDEHAADLGEVLHPILGAGRALLAVRDPAILIARRIGELVGVVDKRLHRRGRLQLRRCIKVFTISEDIRVAGEREGRLLALVVAERRKQNRIDVVELHLFRVPLHPIVQRNGVAGLGELRRPDIVGRLQGHNPWCGRRNRS